MLIESCYEVYNVYMCTRVHCTLYMCNVEEPSTCTLGTRLVCRVREIDLTADRLT